MFCNLGQVFFSACFLAANRGDLIDVFEKSKGWMDSSHLVCQLEVSSIGTWKKSPLAGWMVGTQETGLKSERNILAKIWACLSKILLLLFA